MSPEPTIYYDYIVKPGDTLSGIILKMYGQGPTGAGYRKSLDFVLSLNPQIGNPDRIYPGARIHLGVIRADRPRTPKLSSPSFKPLRALSATRQKDPGTG